MNIDDYRRELEAKIEAARKGGAAEAAGSPDLDRELLADTGAPLDSRIAALARLIAAEETPQAALECLGTAQDDSDLRQAALALLQAAALHDPQYPTWRPAYLNALRSASRDASESMRINAFEVLAGERDRESQAVLLEGLTHPEAARIPPEQALRLLSDDPHAEVREIAAKLADAPPSEAVRLEALRALAGDPDSQARFATLVADPKQSGAVRKLAATALYGLSPEALRKAADMLAAAEGAEAASVDAAEVAQHVRALVGGDTK